MGGCNSGTLQCISMLSHSRLPETCFGSVAPCLVSLTPGFCLTGCEVALATLTEYCNIVGLLRSVCTRLYARDRGGDCSLEEPLPTTKRKPRKEGGGPLNNLLSGGDTSTR